ncbi:MAG: helix-turn-helix domain-containing protein [Clostridia bacterium]|nr:helix-turn-helix domain-containing protein [Clostridia bacterium]
MVRQEIELILGNAKCNMTMNDRSSLPSSSYSHVHPSFELFFVWKGEVQIKTEDGTYNIGEKQAALIAPACYHQTFTVSDTEKFNLHFSLVRTRRSGSEDVYAKLAKAFSGIGVYHITDAGDIGDKIAVLREIRTKECFCREERLRAELTKLILSLYDIMTMHSDIRCTTDIKAASGMQYRYEIDTLLAQNFAGDIDLDFLSKSLYLSPKRVSVLIKSLYGKSFREVRTEMRIQVAKQLLKESELTVNQIAQNVGYSSTRGFLMAFEAHTGCTPTEYRNKNGK